MKKTAILLTILCAIFSLTSCEDFLDTENLTKKDTSNFPRSAEDADQLLTGVYSMLGRCEPLGSSYFISEIMSDNCFGGGAGGSVKITPIAFLIIRDGNVRMLPVAEPASTSMDRLIEQVPDLLDRIDAWRAEKKTPQP